MPTPGASYIAGTRRRFSGFAGARCPTREDAEDATTEIFMKVRQKLGTFDSSRPFTSWLYKVASNHCWDLLRRRRIRQDLETEDVEALPLEHPEPSQLERLQAEHTSKEVRGGLSQAARPRAHGAWCCAISRK